MSRNVKRRWRPRLWAVLLLVLGLVLCLPFTGLLLFKIFANQLVQQTEESLLAQASLLAATYAEIYDPGTASSTAHEPTPDPISTRATRYDPAFPSISLNQNQVLPPRPDGAAPITAPTAHYLAIGQQLSRITQVSQSQTLAGYRLLDPSGTVIAGTAELGLSLASVPEVTRALEGVTISVARIRIRETPEPWLYNFSRGTRVRVFVAMPVHVADQVVGAVYLSRTPNHIFRFLYGERLNLAKATLFILLSAGFIGFVFWRFITRPIHALIAKTHQVGQGAMTWDSNAHFGTREVENLSNSFASLTRRLKNRNDAINTYTAHVTHELKSPLTSVKGAAELLRDEEMSPAQRQSFLENITRDSARMEDLLASMRAFSVADQTTAGGSTTLDHLKAKIEQDFPQLILHIDQGHLRLPLPQKPLTLILKHLLENAVEHGARHVTLSASATSLTVHDDGAGISAGNRDKIMTPFFTTRREQGGTGMGLNIAKSLAEAAGGRLALLESKVGACFQISFTAV